MNEGVKIINLRIIQKRSSKDLFHFLSIVVVFFCLLLLSSLKSKKKKGCISNLSGDNHQLISITFYFRSKNLLKLYCFS